jgi:acyl-CoA synthetase (NDP forming)
MTRKDLTPLLQPRSIVVVGASSNFQRTGGIPIDNLLACGFPREQLLLVNPKYQEIAGLACHPSVASLPFAPDLAILAVRASEVLPALRQCAARGIRAAALFASGFAEEGTPEARAAQHELVRFADESGMVLSGPNCLGHIHFASGAYATFLKRPPQPTRTGPIAVVAQSGNMAAVLWRGGREAGLGFSSLVNTGNEATTELSEYLEHFCDDPSTGAVLAYVEQVRNGPRFLEVAARLRARGKPLFVLKSGSSDKGAEAAASHTAAMAGSAAIYQAAFEQVGAVAATDPARLVDLARLWNSQVIPKTDCVGVVSVSGAGCALLADQFDRRHVRVPTLDTRTQDALRTVVPSYGMVSNPVDLTGQVTNDTRFFPAVVEALMADEQVETLVFYVMGYLLDQLAPELLKAAGLRRKLLVVVDTATGAACHADLEAAGVPVFSDMERAVAATAGYLGWARGVRGPAWAPASMVGSAAPTEPEIAAARAASRLLLTEVEGKRMLARAGLPMVPEAEAASADEAAAHAERLGCPVAVKVLSADVPHKSDVGGVRLNLRDAAAVRTAFEEVVGNTRKACPQAHIQGAVIQPMVTDGQAVLVGIVRDPIFGPTMTVGLGGVLTELYQDVARRVLPIDRANAHAMLRELKSFPLLDGFRGTPVADREALVELMLRLSDYMLQQGAEIAELELNPVLVRPLERPAGTAGALAVDALLRLTQSGG